MTRMDEIKNAYDSSQMSYEDALGRLEALGMFEDEADDFLLSEPAEEVARSSG